MVDDREPRAAIGWVRASVTAAAIVVVGFAVLVFGSHLLLTKVHDVRRSGLVGIVTPLFFLLLVALAAALRWLQRKDVI